jgi:hypothetical protein
MEEGPKATFHKLNNQWCLWAHLPHDTDWELKSYKKIYTFTSVEETIAISETLPETLVKNCMLFLMKENITPSWEDPSNRGGGYFSYKIPNSNVYKVWKELSYAVTGENISNQKQFVDCVAGITISPKKNFCIIKIWMKNCTFQNANIVTDNIKGLTPNGCLFKQHTPERKYIDQNFTGYK